MAQPIKYNTGTKTTGCCIRKGNYDIGIVQNREYGPTANTGFWAGYNVPSGGFVSFQNKASQGPSIYSIPNESSLVDYGRQLNLGGSYTTNESVVQRCSEFDTIALVNIEYPSIPLIDNCLLILDPGYTASYPWGGNSFFNIAGGNLTGGTLIGGGSVFAKGDVSKDWADSTLSYTTDKWVNVPTFSATLNRFTINVWFNIGGAGSNNTNLVGQRYSQSSGYTPENNCNFFIKGDGIGGFDGGLRVSGIDYVINSGVFASGGWNNLTLTYDGGNLIMYVNNTLILSSVVPPPTTNGLDTLIGGSVNGLSSGISNDYFSGRIGVVHIYDNALDGVQVSQIFNQYVSRF
jgi:hypothetical protein